MLLFVEMYVQSFTSSVSKKVLEHNTTLAREHGKL